MSREERRYPWARLGRRFTREQATNTACPDWQRVAFAAWARVNEDGIAWFDQGELAEVAAKVDPNTGEAASVGNARRAVRQAVTHGWLIDGSTTVRVLVHPETVSVGPFVDI